MDSRLAHKPTRLRPAILSFQQLHGQVGEDEAGKRGVRMGAVRILYCGGKLLA